LESDLDKWLYVLKNMAGMDKIPVFLRKTVFEKVFSIAEYVNMTKEEKNMYNAALKRKWDNAAVLDYALKAAKEEGIKEEREKAEADKQKIIVALYGRGMSIEDIAKIVGLPQETVERMLAG
jgi:predicted transposase/invertase (TIGR01784 family)